MAGISEGGSKPLSMESVGFEPDQVFFIMRMLIKKRLQEGLKPVGQLLSELAKETPGPDTSNKLRLLLILEDVFKEYVVEARGRIKEEERQGPNPE